jgi:hypothetical protein
MKTTNDLDRITENLAYIAASPSARFPLGWIAEVETEAREAGILPAQSMRVGIGCRPGIDNCITYGGDMEEVF